MSEKRNKGKRRYRYRDKSKVGSRLIKWLPGESASERHKRRLSLALDCRSNCEVFCGAHGIELEIKNDGHHWIFRTSRGVAEWWPSSAKLVLNKRWRNGIHVHDWEAVMGVVLARLASRKATQ